MPAFLAPFLRNWSQPLGPIPAGVRAGLMGLALLLRLYAGGLIGGLLGLLGLKDLGLLTNPGFVPYGYDKLFAGNVTFGMGPDFFQALGMPLPGLISPLIGVLELVGGLALIGGLLTRLFALPLAGSMLVAMVTFGNIPAELPLFVAAALLVWLGGGLLSVDQLVDRRTAAARRPTPIVSR
ncbi:MAG: DoxX family membrane protein [Chloroflexota bacterium]|nr:DoxX family membrane protein [Chloroflexota bacterium]